VARLSRADLDEVYSLAWRSSDWRRAGVRHGTETTSGGSTMVLHEFRGTEVEPAAHRAGGGRPGRRFHDAIYRAAHHERLYAAWSKHSIRRSMCSFSRATWPVPISARTPTSAT